MGRSKPGNRSQMIKEGSTLHAGLWKQIALGIVVGYLA